MKAARRHGSNPWSYGAQASYARDVKVAVALGGGKSHEAPIHPAMVGKSQNRLEVGSTLNYGIGSAIGSGT